MEHVGLLEVKVEGHAKISRLSNWVQLGNAINQSQNTSVGTEWSKEAKQFFPAVMKQVPRVGH